MKQFLVVALLLTCAPAWSCSCFGTRSIEKTIAIYPNLVEARVENASFNEATLRVSRVLKGRVASDTIVVVGSMCYASLYLDLMKPGHTYLLPLDEAAGARNTLGTTQPGEAIDTMGPKPGEYAMAGCAESGLELVKGELYRFEPTSGAQRRLQHYGDYANFLRWRPINDVLEMMLFFFLTSLMVVAERVGPLPTLILFVPCIALIAMFVHLGAERRRRLIPLVATLPTIWLLTALWGSILRLPDLSSNASVRDPGWQSFPPLVGLVLFFSFAVIFIRRVPVARAFAVSYSLLNSYFAVMMCLFSVMVTNGAMPTPWL